MKNTSINRMVFLGLIVFSGVVISCSEKLKYTIETDGEYNTLFTRYDDWTGGDIASTVYLTDTSTLWLFGDTWVGPVRDNRHYNASMINNSVSVQGGAGSQGKKLTFYYKLKEGKPYSLFTPDNEKSFYWLTGGGIRSGNNLYIIASQIIKKENDSSVFGFETKGNVLFTISNPFDYPVNWKYETDTIPFFHNSEESQTDFGIPQFIIDGKIYVYGVEYRKKEFNRYMLLARVPEDKFRDFDSWEFYSGGKWVGDFMAAERLCDHFGAEYSVSYQPFLKKYVTVYSENGMSEKIVMRLSDKPEGPWGSQEIIYIAPEHGWDKDYFCYAARGHAVLSRQNDLLISYICNSTDFWKMAADARIYRPKFIRIKFN